MLSAVLVRGEYKHIRNCNIDCFYCSWLTGHVFLSSTEIREHTCACHSRWLIRFKYGPKCRAWSIIRFFRSQFREMCVIPEMSSHCSRTNEDVVSRSHDFHKRFEPEETRWCCLREVCLFRKRQDRIYFNGSNRLLLFCNVLRSIHLIKIHWIHEVLSWNFQELREREALEL